MGRRRPGRALAFRECRYGHRPLPDLADSHVQLVQLRHRAVCSVCSSKLPPRSEAWHDEETKRTVCPSCHKIGTAASAPVAPVVPPSADTPDGLDAAGPAPTIPDRPRPRLAHPDPVTPFEGDGIADSPEREAVGKEVDQALIERERAAMRHAEERRLDLERAARAELDRARQASELDAAAKDQGPRPEQSEVRLTPPLPAPAQPPARSGNGWRRTKLPQVGPSLAAGVEAQREIAETEAGTSAIHRALEAARPHGLEIIHSRPWGGTQVENEAIVVAPSGIWVVDGMGDSERPVEKGFLGGHGGSELLNVVGGRTSLISGLLFDSPFQRVPVRGALVFEGTVPGWFDDPFNLAGIAITTPRDLIDQLFTPLHLDADTRRRVAQHLVNRF